MIRPGFFSFRNKILLIILVIGVIPITVTGILSNLEFNRLLERQAEDITMQALRQSEGYLSMYFSEMEQIGIFASTNDQILNLLKKRRFESTYEKVLAANEVDMILKQYLKTRSDIEKVEIYGYNGFSFSGGYSNDTIDESEPWIKEVVDRNGSPYWYSINEGQFMVYSRMITGNKFEEKLGIIRIVIPSYRLESVLNQFQPLHTGFLLLIDQDRHPIIGRNSNGRELALKLDLNNSNKEVSFKGKKMLITQYALDKTDWTFVSVVPRDEIVEGTKQIRKYFLNTVVIILVITLGIAAWMTQIFTRPIKLFIRHMQEVEKNNFKSRLEVRSNDEIGLLTASYNRMVQRVNSLINEVYEQQILKNEAEWNALQAQINPHFLYNTLDSINWIARTHKIPTIVKMVTALSKLFKLSLSKADKFITVEEELAYIKYYAHIQETRFSDRIKIIIDVPEKMRSYPIPRFILQPLVENSVVHGLERQETYGEVHIKGAESGDRIFFIIQDNGVGIPKEKLATLLKPEARHHEHLGLANVDERIKLLYGREWGLKIDSIEDGGTIVEVWLKKDLAKGEARNELPAVDRRR
ncbi:two-component system, sensor histidine kinase YesM [Paenibacillus sp. UNC496MF]|uniref:sensor histidine kinase n=1 Tax=Paenibacillus sp. UNC496MF TaxID=1502753 RepID=UPI0008DFB0E1|nr:sensor histidine kinase [Paenibacillus sp. UNC496MF]SFJ82553.1 two-component system, sensor histidine kinase YesM [Paenibacillus sp. UNC496MF]